MRPFILKSKATLAAAFFALMILFSFIQEGDIRIEKILHQLELFRITRTQQKIYVQSDKQNYLAGENIWLKAYIIEASEFKSDTLSKEVYADLIDFDNKQVYTRILKTNKGMAQGYLNLSDTLAEGNYQIRVYTNWMRNFDDRFFFSKTIHLQNPNYPNIITRARLKSIQHYNSKLKQKQSHREINFFPEGGWLVADIQSVVAFKAENLAGSFENIHGEIYDEKGTYITTLKVIHEGMGIFQIKPAKGARYFAKVVFEDGKSEKFPLPQTLEFGTVMQIDNTDQAKIRLTLSSNKPVSNDEFANDLIIVGQSRGFAPYVSKVQFQGKPIQIDIDKNIFPTGIVQFTVFDGRSNPVCERLVFVHHPASSTLSASIVSDYQNKDSLCLKINLNTESNKPVSGKLSLSVTGNENPDPYASNIISHFYLSSDIRGQVINPGYYFDQNQTGSSEALDILMLTQGWRRYVWPELLSNHLPPVYYQPSEGIAIGGMITKDLFSIPIAESKVKLTILSAYNDVYETITDRLGRFNFPDLRYEDTISVKIEAFKPTGGKGVQILLTDTLIPEIQTITTAVFRNDRFEKNDLRRNNRKEHLTFNKNYKGKPEPDLSVPKIHNTPNDVIYIGEDASSYSNIFQYLQGRVPGVNIVGTKVQIRGISSIYLPTDPLYLIDGVPVDAGTIAQIPVLDIYVVEILKGPEAAIYGSRGANGVIAVYTKHGKFGKRGVIEFGMQGYQKEKEFYPAVENNDLSLRTENNFPYTVYWNPNLRMDKNGECLLKIKKVANVKSYTFVIEGLTFYDEPLYFRFSY